MRADCRHYSRRTGASGEATEQCDVGAAPDAPLRCPEACSQYEARKLSTLGFEYGTLSDARDRVSGDTETEDAGLDALFAEMRDVVDEAADAAVADDAERRRAAEVRASRKRRKRIR